MSRSARNNVIDVKMREKKRSPKIRNTNLTQSPSESKKPGGSTIDEGNLAQRSLEALSAGSQPLEG